MNDVTSTPVSASQTPSHEQISEKAKQLWENYGRPDGRDEEIWLEAERLLQSPSGLPAAQTAPATDSRNAPLRRSGGNAGGASAAPKMPGARSKSAAR